MTLTVAFRVEDAGWTVAAPGHRAYARAAAEAAIGAAGLDPAKCEISVLFANDARLAALNGAFRGKTVPTNVLSWPAVAATPVMAPVRAEDGFLGDIALARETIEKEAEAAHITVDAHAAHLIAHGVLHLLGYDHATDAEAEAMEELERRALAAIGICDPHRTPGGQE